MYAIHFDSYTHLILALGTIREPTVRGFMTSQYPGIHDIGLPTTNRLKCVEERIPCTRVPCRVMLGWGRGGGVSGHITRTWHRTRAHMLCLACRVVLAQVVDRIELMKRHGCSGVIAP